MWSIWQKKSLRIHSVDVQGTKVRIRSCHPAESGGTPCPEKNKENLRLYEEKMDCSRCDCESMPAIELLRTLIVMMAMMFNMVMSNKEADDDG